MQLIEYTGIQSLIIDSLALYTNSEYFQCRVHFRPIPSAQRSHGAEKVYIAKTRLASLVGLPDCRKDLVRYLTITIAKSMNNIPAMAKGAPKPVTKRLKLATQNESNP